MLRPDDLAAAEATARALLAAERRTIAAARDDLANFLRARACPQCEPKRFDAALARVPLAVFCPRHSRGALAFAVGH